MRLTMIRLRGLPGCGKQQPRLFGVWQPRSVALVLLERCPLRILLLAGFPCGWCRVRLCTPLHTYQTLERPEPRTGLLSHLPGSRR